MHLAPPSTFHPPLDAPLASGYDFWHFGTFRFKLFSTVQTVLASRVV